MLEELLADVFRLAAGQRRDDLHRELRWRFGRDQVEHLTDDVAGVWLEANELLNGGGALGVATCRVAGRREERFDDFVGILVEGFAAPCACEADELALGCRLAAR